MDLTSPSRRQARDADLGKSLAALPTSMPKPQWAQQLDALLASRKADEADAVAASRWLQRLPNNEKVGDPAEEIAGSRWLDCLHQELGGG